MRDNAALGAAFQEEEFADYIGLTYDQIASRLQEVDKADKGGRRAVCALQAMLDLLGPASWSAQQVLEVAMEHPDFDRSDFEAEVENMDKPEVEQDKTEKEKMEMEESEKKMEMEESEKKKMEMEESEKKKMEMEEREKKKMEMKERENEKMEMEEREKNKMEMEEREKRP